MTDTTTTPTNDLVDEETLAGLFRAPAEIRDNPEWVEMYDALVRSLRRDASGLPLDMAQVMLIERIASTYMRLSWYGAFGGATNAAIDRMNDQYLKFTTQFQKVLQANDDVLRADLVTKFGKIMADGVDMIPDDANDTRMKIRRFFGLKTREMGY
jgi:hypothetical protein